MVSKKKKVKKIFFCLKSVSGIIDWFSIKKMKKKNFHRKISPKRPNRGAGGGPRGGWQKTTLFPDFFFCYLPLGKLILAPVVVLSQRFTLDLHQLVSPFLRAKRCHVLWKPLFLPGFCINLFSRLLSDLKRTQFLAEHSCNYWSDSLLDDDHASTLGNLRIQHLSNY